MLQYSYSVDFIYVTVPKYHYTGWQIIRDMFSTFCNAKATYLSKLDFKDKVIIEKLYEKGPYPIVENVTNLDQILHRMYFDDLIYVIPNNYCVEEKFKKIDKEDIYNKFSAYPIWTQVKDMIFNTNDTFFETDTSGRIFNSLYKSYLFKLREYLNKHSNSKFFDSEIFLPSQILIFRNNNIRDVYTDTKWYSDDYFDSINGLRYFTNKDNSVESIMNKLWQMEFHQTANEEEYSYSVLKINFNVFND